MTHIINLAELDAIVASLKSSTRRNRPKLTESRLQQSVRKGFAAISDIEDILYHSDSRLDDIRRVVPVQRWCEILSVPTREYYPRPRRRQSSAMGVRGISAEDLADLLMRIESVGYSIDPLGLVRKLSSMVAGRAYVTSAELSILWYEKCRHKASILFTVERGERGQVCREERFRTAAGYKVGVLWNTDSRPLELTVKGPKYRRRRAPVLTECDVCGYEWYRGDPDSSAAHRREHARRMEYLAPKPNPRFGEVEPEQVGLVHVTTGSSRWVHGEIYLRAAAFRREFQYDFVQWSDPKGDADPHVRGYLFIDSANVAVGACAFRWREDEGGSFWGMQWIWIAPKYRRAGVLTKHWNTLRQVHGDFYVEPPVSDAVFG